MDLGSSRFERQTTLHLGIQWWDTVSKSTNKFDTCAKFTDQIAIIKRKTSCYAIIILFKRATIANTTAHQTTFIFRQFQLSLC
jgi:hypothetical protein